MNSTDFIFENFPSGIIIQNHKGEITKINTSASKILDVPKDELKRTGLFNPEWKIVKQDGSEYLDKEFPGKNSLLTGKPINNLVLGFLKPGDKNYSWLRLNIVSELIKDKKKPCRVVTSIEDISEFLVWKNKLIQGEEKFKALVESSSDSIFVIQKGKIKYTNPQLRKLSGYTEKELLNKKFINFVAEKEVEKILSYFKKRDSGQEITNRYESVAVTKDGSHSEVEVLVIPFIYENAPATQLILRDISKRKEAEKKLIQSEKKFREFTNLLPELVYEVDTQLNLLYANKALYHKFGITKKDISRKSFNISDLLYREDKSRFIENFEKALKGEQSSGNAYRAIYKDRLFYLQIFNSPIYEKQKVVGSRGIVIDITKQKLAEKKLIESKKRYSNVFYNTSIGLYETTPEGKILTANPAIIKMLGFDSLEDLLTRDLSNGSYVDENQREIFKETLEKDGSIKDFISQWYTKQGQIITVKENASAVKNKKGIIKHYVGSVENITEQKIVLDELIESENRISKIVSNSRNAIFTINNKMQFTFLNEAALQLFGYQEDEILLQNFQKILDEKSLDLVTENYIKRQAGEKIPARYRFKIQRKNGTIKIVEITSSVYENSKGKPVTVCNLLDITNEIKEKEILIKAEQRFNSFFNSNTALMFIKDSKRRYVEANDKMGAFFDKNKEELIGKKDEELTGSSIITPCPSSDKRVLTEKKLFTTEEKLGNRTYRVTKFPIKINKDLLIGGILQDITERKKNETIKDIVLNISNISSQNISLKEFFLQIHKQIKYILTAENVYVALYDENSHTYTFPYHEDEKEDYESSTPKQLENSLTDFIQKEGKGYLITKKEKKELHKIKNIKFVGEPSKVWMGAPLIDISNNKIIGVIALQDYKDENTYNKDDLKTLEIIAGYIGQFIERAKNIKKLIQAKENAIESEKRYKSLFNDNASVMMLINPDTGSIVDANNAACNFYGYTYNELTKKNIQQINIHSNNKVKNRMQKAYLNKQKHFIFKHRLANGNIKPVEIYSGRVVVNKKPLLYSIVHDISKRVEAEKQIKILMASVEQSPVITIITDTDGNIEYTNQAFYQITGYTVEEALGRNPSFLQSGKTPAKTYEEMWDTVLKGKRWTGKFINLKKNGEEFIEKSTISPLIDETGKIIKLLATKEDYTKQQKAENENLLLFTAIRQSPEPIALTNLSGKFIFVNPQYCNLSGYSEKELLGNHTRILKSGKQSNEFYKNLWSTIRNRKNWSGEIINRKKNGDLFTEEAKISPVLNNKGKVTHYVKVARDITQQKKMVRELINAKEKAEESDRLKSAFLANMSHEIRTPMNGILGFTDLLKDPDFNEEMKSEFIDSIQKSGDRLLNTVNDIVEISKLEVGEITVKKKELNFNKKIAEIVLFFIPEAENKGLSLHTALSLNEQEATIVTDESKFESIITNLVKNAIKYSDAGKIEFGYTKKENHVLFYCKDEGIGIPENRQVAIFNRFEQVDIEDTRIFEGSGLGLAITKAYVEMMNGEIWVESVEGKGSTFYFTLPLNDVETKPEQKTEEK